MKKIVLATDFSENAKVAFGYAHELSRRLGADLILLYVVESTITLPDPITGEYPDIMYPQVDELLEELKQWSQQDVYGNAPGSEMTFEIKVAPSAPSAIIEFVKEVGADLLIMGRKGRSVIQEFVMGSTVKKVLRQSPCPVLTIPIEAPFRAFDEIVYASAFDSDDVRVISALTILASLFDAKIFILHISDEVGIIGEKKMKRFKELLEEQVEYRNFEYVFSSSDYTYKELAFYLTLHDHPLLCMLEREKPDSPPKWLYGDLVMKSESKTYFPILTYNGAFLAARSMVK